MTLSIITINYNNRDGLEKTLGSVFENQPGFTDFEEIVIDGGSTDGSVDVIRKYEDHLSHWVSEPDKGIYNAMNKGIMKARGKFLLFLNSGDCLIAGVLPKLKIWDETADVIFGNVRMGEEETPIRRCDSRPDKAVSPEFFLSSGIPHQAAFISKKMLLQDGMYDESFRIQADMNFFFRALTIHHAKFVHVSEDISRIDIGGVSKQKSSIKTSIDEKHRIIAPYYGESFAKFADGGKLFQWLYTDERKNMICGDFALYGEWSRLFFSNSKKFPGDREKDGMLYFASLYFFLKRHAITRVALDAAIRIMKQIEKRRLARQPRK